MLIQIEKGEMKLNNYYFQKIIPRIFGKMTNTKVYPDLDILLQFL